jgi:hypothetical protein
MKITGLPKKILQEICENPVSRVDLDKKFGKSAKLAISSLCARHLADWTFEKKDTQDAPTEISKLLISITPLGKQQIDPEFCSACECTPCDCNWGN